MHSSLHWFLVLLCTVSVPAADVAIETAALRFMVSAERSTAELVDKAAGVSWRSLSESLGDVSFTDDGKPGRVQLRNPVVTASGQAMTLDFLLSTNSTGTQLRVTAQTAGDGSTLEISWQAGPRLNVESIRLFDGLLATSGDGYLVVPVREGLFVPANSGKTFTNRFDTYAYEGCHMAMFGVAKSGATALVYWKDPYPVLEVRSTIGDSQMLSPVLAHRKTSRSFFIQVLGKSGYVGIARAYREVARNTGWLVTWDDKLKGNPERARLFGASNFKLWSMLTRRMNEDSSKEISARVSWTFDEAAQVAYHLKHDLKLDKVLFTMGGWIHRGYDNQHPDVLPAAPELGGDADFARSSKRIMDLGYLLCLHDNYQDIYRDSPSWNERYIQKTASGGLTKGGHWAGGVAYITCAEMALELAKRPQNLAAVKKLSHANSYFIDTTYAAGLQECFDKEHPLTRADDMKWKQALSDYGREVFGVFGSECGREWAIPHSDFFEGLTGVSGKFYHSLDPDKLGATSIPLFELVYRDTIALYGKYGYEAASAAEYVLHHIMLGRPLHYHNVPSHMYWTGQNGRGDSMPLTPSISEFKQASPRQFSLAYEWNVDGPIKQDALIFVHFTDSKGKILFQGDHPDPPMLSQWKEGKVKQGPFKVTVPSGLEGVFDVRVGLFDHESGSRFALKGTDDGERRYLVGRVKLAGETMQFQPLTKDAPALAGLDRALFCRADGGWAEGMHQYDRFLKNTHEVLSPLNEITSRVPMTRHEFLSPDRKVQRTEFGQGLATVIVNAGTNEFRATSTLGGEVVLHPGGFLVESPEFVAFHALTWSGIRYDTAPLFTFRSRDKEPLSRSRSIQVFHAFGPSDIKLGASSHQVRREGIITK